LGDGPIKITSPERALGRNSGQEREIDVSLRGRLGSADLFVMIECRDRSRAGTIEWIDQAIAKGEDVGASKVVLVSAAGFTKNAKDYADRRGVEMRLLDHLTPSEILDWVAESLQSIQVSIQRVEFLRVTINLRQDARSIDPIPGSPPEVSLERPIFRRVTDDHMASVNEMWNRMNQNEIFAGTGSDRRRVTVRGRLRDPVERFQVKIRDEWWDVEEIVFTADIWRELIDTPISRFRYEKDGELLSEGFSWKMDIGSLVQTVALTRRVDHQGNAYLTLATEAEMTHAGEAREPFSFE
jgi:hypothetical protein